MVWINFQHLPMSRNNFTIGHLQQSACADRNRHLFQKRSKKQPVPFIIRRSKEKDWILLNLQYWCNEKTLELQTEPEFAPGRKYRFDYAIPALMIAVEYEGIFSQKSRHTTAKGYSGDTDKYNLAQSLGWRVIRLTALNYTNLITQLEKYT